MVNISEESDLYSLPSPQNGTISSAIRYNLNLTELTSSERFHLTVGVHATEGLDRADDSISLQDSRVQIIIPVQDPIWSVEGPPDWLPIKELDNIEIERRSWNEGREASITLKASGEIAQSIPLSFLVVLKDFKLNPQEIMLKIVGRKISQGCQEIICDERCNFTNDEGLESRSFRGDDEALVELFSDLGCYELIGQGTIIHPKQIHSYSAVCSALFEQSTDHSPLRIAYIGSDTCENLHSVIRAISNMQQSGIEIERLVVGYTEWDERILDKLGLLKPEYFIQLGFEVRWIKIEDEMLDTESDIVLTTYVANWAFSSQRRGSSGEQFLGRIISNMLGPKTRIISIDPLDKNRVTRSFDCLGHQGSPRVVYEGAGLIKLPTAPGGYGDYLLEQEKEVCWVSCYQQSETIQHSLYLEPISPSPNDIANLLGIVYPTGREAIIERLVTPKLEEKIFSLQSHDISLGGKIKDQYEISRIVGSGSMGMMVEVEATDIVETFDQLASDFGRFKLIIGGPGDGKTVLLKRLAWEKRLLEQEVTVFLPARALAIDKHLLSLRMAEEEGYVRNFLQVMESSCLDQYSSISWDGDIYQWFEQGCEINLIIDAWDEIRNIDYREQLLEHLLKVIDDTENINITISLRENVLGQMIDGVMGAESHSIEVVRTFKLLWDEDQLRTNFIPSLLHGWNMHLDTKAEGELQSFMDRAKAALRSSSGGGKATRSKAGRKRKKTFIFDSDISNLDEEILYHHRPLLSNPLRAVWLVRFIYNQNLDLKRMNLSEFENEILRLSIEDRVKSRRLGGHDVPENLLLELLDIVATIAMFDYEWFGNSGISFNEKIRSDFVNSIKNASNLSDFFRNSSFKDLLTIMFEDMSLLFITGSDDLAWVHENLREHAILRCVVRLTDPESICTELVQEWSFEAPSIIEIASTNSDVNESKVCSMELADATLRVISDEELFSIINKTIIVPENLNQHEDDGENFKEIMKFLSNEMGVMREQRDNQNSISKKYMDKRNKLNSEVKKLIANVRTQRDLREQKNLEVREKKQVRSALNVQVRAAKDKLALLRGDGDYSKDEGSSGRGRQRSSPPTVHSLRRESDRLEREFADGKHIGKNEVKMMKRLKEIIAQIRDLQKSEDGNVELKQAREEMRIALEAQEASHLEVKRSAKEAQQAHDIMIEYNNEVSKIREIGQEAHKSFRNSKKEADTIHNEYIFLLRLLKEYRTRRHVGRGRERSEKKKQQYLNVQNATHLDENEVIAFVNIYLNENFLGTGSKIIVNDIDILPLNKLGARKILISCNKPGKLIGKNGKNVKEMSHSLEEKFGPPIKVVISKFE